MPSLPIKKTLPDFVKEYFPHIDAGMSKLFDFHHRAIVNDDELFLRHTPGEGATMSSIVTLLWAALEGIRPGTAYVGPSYDHARDVLQYLLSELATNKRLHAGYPEACVPFLDDSVRSRRGRVVRNVLYFHGDDPRSRDSVIAFFGILSSPRGFCFRRTATDGTVFRLSHVIFDDVHSRAAIESPAQRERTLDHMKNFGRMNDPRHTSRIQLKRRRRLNNDE